MAGFDVRLTLAIGAIAAAGPAIAQTQEPALASHFADSALAWSPCPPELPAGCTLAVLHGDPAKPGADVLLKLPARSTIAKHTHTSSERIVLLAGELHATYDGQDASVLKVGSYAYGPAARPHVAECVSAEPCVLFIAFDAPVDVKLVEQP